MIKKIPLDIIAKPTKAKKKPEKRCEKKLPIMENYTIDRYDFIMYKCNIIYQNYINTLELGDEESPNVEEINNAVIMFLNKILSEKGPYYNGYKE